MANYVTPASLAKMASSFVAIGGRLMIDPQGRYMTGIDMARLFERTSPNPEWSRAGSPWRVRASSHCSRS